MFVGRKKRSVLLFLSVDLPMAPIQRSEANKDQSQNHGYDAILHSSCLSIRQGQLYRNQQSGVIQQNLDLVSFHIIDT